MEDSSAVLTNMSELEPLVKAARDQMSNPEARNLSLKALKTLETSAEVRK